jgi:hypothetical protein
VSIKNIRIQIVALRGVVGVLSDLRDKGPGFKTGSQPLTFMKAATEFQNPTRYEVLIALTNSVEFRHAKDVKTNCIKSLN